MKSLLTVVYVCLFTFCLQSQVWLEDAWLAGISYTSGQLRLADVEYGSSMKTATLSAVGPLGKNFYLEATESLGLDNGFNVNFEGIGVGFVAHLIKKELWQFSLGGSYLVKTDYYTSGEAVLKQLFGTHLIYQFPLAELGRLRVRYTLQSRQQSILNADDQPPIVWSYAHIVEPMITNLPELFTTSEKLGYEAGIHLAWDKQFFIGLAGACWVELTKRVFAGLSTVVDSQGAAFTLHICGTYPERARGSA